MPDYDLFSHQQINSFNMKVNLLHKEFLFFRNFLFVVAVLASSITAHAQCTYTGTPLTRAGNELTFCVDGATTTASVPSVKSGEFVVVNVVKGFKYTFSVPDVFAGATAENLTIFNALDNTAVGAAGFNSGPSGATITNWTATFSGKIKVLLSKGNCINDGTAGGTMTLILTSTGNTQDSQTSFETDKWIGHIYNWTGVAPPGGTSPTTLSNTISPFINDNYVGYYSEPSEAINRSFGGDATCFPVLSNGVNSVNIRTETFAVRYRMKSTKTGYYFLNVAGDDGVRVYVDNVLVFNAWKEQSNTSYCNNLIYLNGTSTIVLDYYENAGMNIVSFSMTPFNISSNEIVGAATRSLCTGATTVLDGTTYTPCAASSISNVTFQWQVSTNNSSFSNVTTGTSGTAEDYTPAAQTPNTTLYYRRVVRPTAANPAGQPINSNVITVYTGTGGALIAPSTINGNSAVCALSAGNNYSVATVANALLYTWTVPTGWTITAGQGTPTITVTAGSAGQSGNISVIVSNGCATNATKTLAVTASAATVAGSISPLNATVCTGSSTTLELAGHVGNILRWERLTAPASTWTAIANTSQSLNTGAITATTQFRAVIKNGNCAELFTASTTITTGVTTTWLGSNWSNSAPTSTTTAIIAANYSLAEDITACSLTVNSGAAVIIPSGYSVTLSGALTNNGSFTLENNANLIQSGSANTNTGNIIVKRNSSALMRQDYTLWSSPTFGAQTLFQFSPATLTNRFYNYNTSSDLYSVVSNSETFTNAKGYLIRMPNTHPTTPGIWPGVFTGVPNNGNISTTMINITNDKVRRFNLVGNPYPSPISATKFAADNINNITGTLYFWRKTNDSTKPSYFTWTTLGFTGATNVNVEFPTQNIIQTGQGFFVEAKDAATSLAFTNSMRVNDHQNKFFKVGSTTEYNRIWLNATNAEGWFSQTLLGYFTDGQDELDSSDGRYINDGDIALSSLINDESYAIQGKSLPFNPSDIVPMQLKVKNAGTYTIAIDHVDGLFEGAQDIFLRDTQTGVDHDLKAGAYTFVTEAGTFSDRFNIVYQNMLGTTTNTFDANSVAVAKNNNVLSVSAGSETINSVQIFDLQGRKIFSKSNIDSATTNISDLNIANQIILIQVSTDKGIVTKKVQF